MGTTEIILAVVMLLFSLAALVIAVFQWKEKGILLNNAYILASREERARMNKTPHYRQSAVGFGVLGIIFFSIALAVSTGWNALFPVVIIFSVLLVIYAIASSVAIEKNKTGR